MYVSWTLMKQWSVIRYNLKMALQMNPDLNYLWPFQYPTLSWTYLSRDPAATRHDHRRGSHGSQGQEGWVPEFYYSTETFFTPV